MNITFSQELRMSVMDQGKNNKDFYEPIRKQNTNFSSLIFVENVLQMERNKESREDILN